jgi:predicted HTH transcriptional regulator
VISSKGEIVDALRDRSLREHLHVNVELKESWHEEHGKRLSALANRPELSTTWLIVGVTDLGQATGRDESWARKTEEIVSQHVNHRLDPVQACLSIDCLNTDEGWIIAIGCKNPGAVVYWGGSAYKRAGTTIAEMRPEEVLEFTIKLPGLTDYSRQPWHGEVSDALVANYASAVALKQNEPTLAARRGLTSDQVLVRLNLLGRNVTRLLFGDCSYRVVLCDNEGVPGQNVKQYGLFDLLEGTFVERVQGWARLQLGTPDPEPFPQLALKEALANAVAHAAYFEGDGDITIEAFPDRIVISNLCLPESRFFANKWFSRSRNTVNNLLMEALRLAGFVDELGRGKNLIFRESILAGKRPPQVTVERAGRYDRWRLFLYGGTKDPIQLRLLRRIRETYTDPHKALIAYALILWRDESIAEIRKHIEGESIPVFLEVLSDVNGPIFYWKEQDRVLPRRWVRVLLDEGKDSKTLTLAEETDLFNLAYDIRTRHHHGYFAPKDIRKLADMGETASERSATSNLLKKWVEEKRIRKVKTGVYAFLPVPVPPSTIQELLARFMA